MSSFSDGVTTATFRASTTSFKHAGPPPQDLDVSVDVSSDVDFYALLDLQSWNVHVDRAPGGNTVWVDIGSGAGEGTLVIDDLASWDAILTGVDGDAPIGATGRRIVKCKFILTAIL